jgi:hypothetical protein
VINSCLYPVVTPFALIEERWGLTITAHHGQTTKTAQGATTG